MKYTLMHRKIAVAEIEIDTETATISEISNVLAPEHDKTERKHDVEVKQRA